MPTTNATIYFLKQAMKIEKNGSSIYRKDKKENTGVFPLFLIHTCNKSSVAISLLKEVSTEILPILYRIRHLTFFQLVLISWMVTLSSCLIWQIISFILPPKENGCIYAWTTLESGPAIDLQNMPILAKKNHLFRWSSFWSWWVCKQAKLSYLGHRKPSRIHWKADAPKTSHCLVRILV